MIDRVLKLDNPKILYDKTFINDAVLLLGKERASFISMAL